jgi:hypothetical protein
MLARAQGRSEEALAGMRGAADLEASTDKHPVTPGAIVPVRELLGDLLLEMDQPAQTLGEYERSLTTDPNQFRSVYGGAKAAERSGDAAKAGVYYKQLAAPDPGLIRGSPHPKACGSFDVGRSCRAIGARSHRRGRLGRNIDHFPCP